MSFPSGDKDEALTTSASKQTTNVTFFPRIFSKDSWGLANFFSEMIETKIDNHKILDNFHLKRLLPFSENLW